MQHQRSQLDPSQQPQHPQRRTFIEWCIHGVGGLFALVLGAPIVAYLIDARNRKAPESGFRLLRDVDLEKVRAEPKGFVMQATVRAVRHDAWTFHPNDVLGRVYIVKTGEGTENKDITVLSTTCPHLGCAVNHTGPNFTCPCHNGKFELDGKRIEEPGVTNPAPRGMDTLQWEGEADSPRVFKVKFEKFKQAIPTKEVVS